MNFLSNDERLMALEDSIVRRVELRSQAVYWLIREKNKEVISILADMSSRRRENWLLSVHEVYKDCQYFLDWSEMWINRGKELIRRATENGRNVLADEYANGVVELGVGYKYWEILKSACKDIFDAVWRMGTTVPISDSAKPPDAGNDRQLFAMFSDSAKKQHKKAEATKDRMEKIPKAGKEYESPRRSDIEEMRRIDIGLDDEEDEQRDNKRHTR